MVEIGFDEDAWAWRPGVFVQTTRRYSAHPNISLAALLEVANGGMGEMHGVDALFVCSALSNQVTATLQVA